MLRRPIGAHVVILVMEIEPKWLFEHERLPTLDLELFDKAKRNLKPKGENHVFNCHKLHVLRTIVNAACITDNCQRCICYGQMSTLRILRSIVNATCITDKHQRYMYYGQLSTLHVLRTNVNAVLKPNLFSSCWRSSSVQSEKQSQIVLPK